ncbi:MAG: LacI family DNA-binding transcriptional regulator [Succinivibrio sp.]
MIKRPRLDDIASKVGVTRMTVSRYFNDPQSVAEATREKIARAIGESGFIPSRVPAMMSRSSSMALGLVVPSFSNGVFTDVIDGVEEAARASGYSVLLMHSGYGKDREEEDVAALLSYQADAVILCGSVHTDLTCLRMRKSGVPSAELLSLSESPLGLNYGIDYAATFRAATMALISCGRKAVAYFGARMDERTLERERGYRQAVAKAGIKPLCLNTNARSNFALGRDLMLDALRRFPEVDAVVCTNDDVALGALIACQSQGVDVPGRISVIGCNALNFCDAAFPTLCSIATPRRQIASKAASDLIGAIKAKGRDFKQSRQIWGCSLKKGGSATAMEQDAIEKALKALPSTARA